jgi:hypothetical protein
MGNAEYRLEMSPSLFGTPQRSKTPSRFVIEKKKARYSKVDQQKLLFAAANQIYNDLNGI